MTENVAARGRAMTTAEVAGALGCSTKTVQRLVREGELPALQIGTHRLTIFAADLDAYINRHIIIGGAK